MTKKEKNKLKEIFQQASLRPQNLYVLYFYYRDSIKSLELTDKEYEKAVKILKNIMGINSIPSWRNNDSSNRY